MSTLWSCIEAGRTTAIVGRPLPAAPPDSGWRVLRIAADGPVRHLGPVLEARRRIEDAVGRQSTLRDLVADRVKSGIRRRLLGEAEAIDKAWPLVEPLNRLAAAVDGSVAVVFDGVQAADPATLQLLEEVVTHPGRLGLALVLVFDALPTEGPAATLLASVKRVEGPRGVVGSTEGPETWAELQPVAFSTEDDEPVPEPPAPEPEPVIDATPEPAPEPTPELAPEPEPEPELPIEDAPAANGPNFGPLPLDARLVLRAAAMVGAEFDADRVGELLERKSTRVMEAVQLALDAGYPVDDLGRGHFRMPAALADVLVRELTPSLSAAWSERLARLTSHSSPNRFVQAADEAASLGAFPEAIAYARRALELLPEEERVDRCRLHLQVGTLLWRAAAIGGEFTLPHALEELGKAESLLTDDDPVLLRAEIRQAVGGVCYDLADPESLERALSELALAIRELSSEQHPLEAAGLLNDQAAVYVRLDDPVRAAALLRQSREIFTSLDRTDLVKTELAETDHLLARLPLHVQAREGHEGEALQRALAHAENALKLYTSVGRRRCVAHVQETSGRLLTRIGNVEAARDQLTRAFATQDTLGDVLGMARSTAALSDLKMVEGDLEGALSYLAESVRLNSAKGARQGLDWNREALATITERLPRQDSLRLSPMLQAVQQELDAAGVRG